MIKIENLCVKKKIPGISHLELTIEAGESYVLLTAEDTATNHLLDIFFGIETLFRGRVLVDGTDILTDAGACRSRLACLGKEHGWPQDMRVKNLLSFFGKKTGISEEEHEELFITSDMEGLSAKKIGDLEETQWRRLLFFLVRLKQCKNFVIHDFAKGMPYDFIVDFKKNIAKMKQSGCSILYLSDDVFFASEIGDRVGFMKKGKLLLELNSRKMKNMSLQELYFQFMAER